jgi:MFS family permease
VHSYGDPAFGFQGDFFLNLTHTQYALYYVVGSLLAYVLGVTYASVGMMCLYLGGTVLALRALLMAIGKDERQALFVIPLLVNPMFLIGLMPFMCGMPLMFLSLAVSVRHIEKPTRGRGIALAVLAVALFFAHVGPYAIFGVAFAALFPWARPSKWLAAAAPVVPSLLAVAWWIEGSSQGKESAGALSAAFRHPPFLEAMSRFPQWSIDVFRDSTDEQHAIALFLVALVAVGLAQGDRDRTKPAARALLVIPVVCTVMYFSTGSMLGDVWLFSERFPVPLLMSLVPLLRMPTGARGWLVTALAMAVGASSTVNVCKHFIAFEKDEVGDFDDALAAMEPRKHVAGLIYDKGSALVNVVPFLHFVSYYQAQKGGVVQFSNSGALYWPVRWRDGHYPPPGTRPRLRWEWTPEQVGLQELYPYYDYVLVRGSGFNPPPGSFRPVFRGTKWSVYQRVDR